MMTEETDQKLEEMTVYAYELSHPKAKLLFGLEKDRYLISFFRFSGLFTIVSLLLSTIERPCYNSWVHAGMFSLLYVYMLKLRKTPIEEGVTARGKTKILLQSPSMVPTNFVIDPRHSSLPFGLIGALIFITLFCLIDGFQVSQLKWDYF